MPRPPKHRHHWEKLEPALRPLWDCTHPYGFYDEPRGGDECRQPAVIGCKGLCGAARCKQHRKQTRCKERP